MSYDYKLQDSLSHLIFKYFKLSIDFVNTSLASIIPPVEPKNVPTLPVYYNTPSSTTTAKFITKLYKVSFRVITT